MDPEDKKSQKVVPMEEEEKTSGGDDESENPNKSVDPNLEKSLQQGMPDNPVPPSEYLPIKKRKTPMTVPKTEEEVSSSSSGQSPSKSQDPDLAKSLKRKHLSNPLPLPKFIETSVIKKLKGFKFKETEKAGPSTSTSTSTSSMSSFLTREDENNVLKKIFSLLDAQTLIECRLMSRNANSIATATLFSKKQKLQFVDLNLQVEGSERQKRLPELTQLLKISRMLNLSFPFKNFGFMYSVFASSQDILGNPEFQDFITHHGEHVEELSITYVESAPPCTKSAELVVMDQVRHLLIRQTPNLRVFEFGCPVIIAWKDIEFPDRPPSSPLIQTDPEYFTIQMKTKAEERLNTNVKSFKFRELTLNSSKIVETIIELCPNLEAIFTGLVDPRVSCLFHPINRLHLIKQMAIFNHSERNLRGHINRWPQLIRHTTSFGVQIRMLGIHWTVISDIDPELAEQLKGILKQMLDPGVELKYFVRTRPT